MKKINLCVIFGGQSSEHEVSCISASSVIENVNTDKCNIHMIGITKDGKWLYYEGDTDKIRNGNWEDKMVCSCVIPPDRSVGGLLKFADNGVEKIDIDVVFPVLHGKYGEDGTVQGLLELAGIPYVGSGVIGSSICMDKCVAKILFKHAGINQAEWVELRRGKDIDTSHIESKLGYPCFVKPSNAGSSVGVSRALNKEELLAGIKAAFEHDCKVLVEETVNAREIECSVLGNDDVVTADVLGEIVPSNEFYDYNAKYNDERSRLIIPADLGELTAGKIKEYAKRAYRICECRGLARVDFFVDKQNGEIYLNEINTMPGFTSISMYPKLWEASGVGFTELIDRLIELALKG